MRFRRNRNVWKHYICNVFSMFIIVGLVIMLVGGVWPLVIVIYAPKYNFSPSFSGLGIARNTTGVEPEGFYIVVGVEPQTLDFDYYFSYYENGTYNFIFVFPFYINKVIYKSEEMSINSTNGGSVVCLSDYLTTNTTERVAHRHIFGSFYINRTFETGSKGSYTFTLPFGAGISPDLGMSQQQKLQVAFVQEKITLNVALPFDYMVTETFPPVSSGPQHVPDLTNQTFQSLAWELSSPPTDVTIRVENQGEIEYYQTLPFISGIFIGIGSSVMTTSIYDGFKEKYKKEKPSTI